MASAHQTKNTTPLAANLADVNPEAALLPIMAVAAGLLQEPEQTDDVNEFWEAHLDECKDLHQQAREVRQAGEETLKMSQEAHQEAREVRQASEETLKMSQEAHQEARELREMTKAHGRQVDAYCKRVDTYCERVDALAEEVHVFSKRVERACIKAKANGDAAEERYRQILERLERLDQRRAEKNERASAALTKSTSATPKRPIRRGKQYKKLSRPRRPRTPSKVETHGLLEIIRRLLHALHLLIQRRRAASKPRTPGVEVATALQLGLAA